MNAESDDRNLEATLNRILSERERSLQYTLALLGASRDVRATLHYSGTSRLEQQLKDARNALAAFEGLNKYRADGWDNQLRNQYISRAGELERELAKERIGFWKDLLDLDRTLQLYQGRLAKERALRSLRHASR